MENRPTGTNNVFKLLQLVVLILTITCGYRQLRAQDRETLLFEENFDDLQARNWELEDGWIITEGMLQGTGHS